MATGDNNAHGITGREIQLYQPQGVSNEGLDSSVNKHDDDDVQSPTPISQFRQPETGDEEIETPESSRGQSSKIGQHQTVSGTGEEQQTSARKPSTRKNRTLITSRVLETKDVYFRVFKFPGDEEQYVLEMHKVETGAIYRYRVEVGKVEATEEKWGIQVYDLETGQHVVFPMTEDSNLPKFLKKYQLSLQERLEGWTVEKRVRINSGKEETFYRHWSRTFRSLLEVSGFILYSCEPKDLRAVNQEEEAVDAIMQISSAEAGSAHDNVDAGASATKMEGSENVN